MLWNGKLKYGCLPPNLPLLFNWSPGLPEAEIMRAHITFMGENSSANTALTTASSPYKKTVDGICKSHGIFLGTFFIKVFDPYVLTKRKKIKVNIHLTDNENFTNVELCYICSCLRVWFNNLTASYLFLPLCLYIWKIKTHSAKYCPWDTYEYLI